MRNFGLSLVLLVLTASPAAARNGSPPPGATTALPTSQADHNANNVLTTVTDVGAYGWFDPQGGVILGQGFQFMAFPSALFHGGLVYGTSAFSVSDASYGSDDNGFTRPFNFVSTDPVTVGTSGAITQYTCAGFNDADFDSIPLGVSTLQGTYAWTGDSYIIIDVIITASNALTGFFVGLYTDWDIGDATMNVVDPYDAARKLGPMRAAVAGADPNFYGTQLLSHPASGYRAVLNRVFVYPNPPVDPGFQDADKFTFFSGFAVTEGAAPDDWSNMISAGPFNLAAGGEVRVAFALLGASTLANLGTQADQAQARWNAGITHPCQVVEGIPSPEGAPVLARLTQNHPNPFAPVTTIEYALAKPARVSLRVYDIEGNLVRELVNGRQNATSHRAEWDGRDGAGRELGNGVYFYQLTGPGIRETRRMVLIR